MSKECVKRIAAEDKAKDTAKKLKATKQQLGESGYQRRRDLKSSRERDFATQANAEAMMEEARLVMKYVHQAKVEEYQVKLYAVREERCHSSEKQQEAKALLERECREYNAIISTLKQRQQKEMEAMEKKLSKEREKADKAQVKLEVKMDNQALREKERVGQLQCR